MEMTLPTYQSRFVAGRAAAKLERRAIRRRPMFTQAFFDLEPDVRRRLAMRIGLTDPCAELALTDLEAAALWIETARQLDRINNLQQQTWRAWRRIRAER